MDIIVIDYCSDHPEGTERPIKSEHIEKFYAPPEDMKYIIGSGEGWFKRHANKKLIKNGKLFKMWNEESGLHVGYVKPDCHPVMLEVRYASDTNIYDGSTYIQYYFSDTPLDEFIKIHGDSRYVHDESEELYEEPIENRWQILDL